MDRMALTLNRTSGSAILQLQNQFYCSPGGRGACGLGGGGGSTPRLLPGADDGSLPQTPEEAGSLDPEAGFPEDPFSRRTYQLVLGFIRHHAQQPAPSPGWFGGGCSDDRRTAETLQRIGDRLIEKHGPAFTGMVNRLNVSQKEDLDTIQRVATEMFSDGEVNWGRVVSFIAFGAVMGNHLKKIQREDCIEEVAVKVTKYLTQQKREWLETQNGWDGFTKFFHENNAEESAKKALMWIAGFGIAGASIMHLLR
ncbi:induced myeloid leukemia cell differentiation protein Mcl-1 homolog [Scyliorhinus canicula]|uniref:induced myeloid leukemia cell differentiation protein Mcl-1 homolog n=1 Tax=Scyliorhinus canicula TaxID=7830 RepID=UPI0018F453F6|nr:induced myeloid leukemia cell differentiation protein Mcl-1 homolog [Scyliorhinus canicula]